MIVGIAYKFNVECMNWFDNLESTSCQITGKKIIKNYDHSMNNIYERYPYDGVLDITIFGNDECYNISPKVYTSYDIENIKLFLQKYKVNKTIDCYFLKNGSFKNFMKKRYINEEIYFDNIYPYFDHFTIILFLIYSIWLSFINMVL